MKGTTSPKVNEITMVNASCAPRPASMRRELPSMDARTNTHGSNLPRFQRCPSTPANSRKDISCASLPSGNDIYRMGKPSTSVSVRRPHAPPTPANSLRGLGSRPTSDNDQVSFAGRDTVASSSSDGPITIDAIIEKNPETWKKAISHPFLDAIKDGTCSQDQFNTWLSQVSDVFCVVGPTLV